MWAQGDPLPPQDVCPVVPQLTDIWSKQPGIAVKPGFCQDLSEDGEILAQLMSVHTKPSFLLKAVGL